MNAFLDTLDLARRMEDRGISPQHAEGIAEAIKTVWLSYDEASRREIATSAEVRETELNLQKEIEQVRSDLRETELNLQKEIEQVRSNLRETELCLQKEIEQVRSDLRETELRLQKEIEQVRSDLRETELRLQNEIKETELRLQKEIDQVRAEIQKSKYSLLRWQIGGWLALAAIMAKGFGWIGF